MKLGIAIGMWSSVPARPRFATFADQVTIVSLDPREVREAFRCVEEALSQANDTDQVLADLGAMLSAVRP